MAAWVSLDPSHSAEDERYLVLGQSNRGRLLVVAYAERNANPNHQRTSSNTNFMTTKKDKTRKGLDPDRDTLQPEYDFSKATRGATAARFAEGTNVVVIDPELQPLFPTSEAVNDALRGLATIAKRANTARRKGRSA